MIVYIIIFILSYILGYYIYNNPSNYKIVRKHGLNELEKFDFNYFNKNYGKHQIIISYSPSTAVDMDTTYKKVKLTEYIDEYMHDSNWYFKTEDEYDFLKEIKLSNNILTIFKKFYRHWGILYHTLSFWMGGKGSVTGFHTDIEDVTYLHVISGQKKINLIHPKYTGYMYVRKEYYDFSLWSEIDFKNIDYKKYPLFNKVVIDEVILNKGDCISIPRNWWHSVENMEDTIAISYKIYRPWFILFGVIPEYFRRKYKYCM